ncbi:uncharacterized protein LOC110771117 [Prunus avium]|uniref:Uncharacterized protein LOC110771117 n=1 Tax=Prunus avium TaxID=42229 RepID=A0A6P5TVI8_PRUAV|nr:uncharacterized protein LOC110771117 [Prunus avium]
MVNLAKLEFAALDYYGSDASPEEKAKAMIFLHRHIHEVLKNEYVAVDDPLVQWKALCKRYNHQKKDMLEKTLSTFYASNVLLQQQYRHSGFTKYSELVSCLLLAEQNNELLLKNHQSRPTASAPLPEVNAASQEVNVISSRDSIHRYGQGGKRGRWQGNKKDRSAHSYGLGPRSNLSTSGKNASRNKGKAQTSHVPRNVECACHRCGAKGHWVRTCHMLKHLADLYQSSLKNRKMETNYIDHVIPDLPATDGSSEISTNSIFNRFIHQNK